jgi:hypothetical protein
MKKMIFTLLLAVICTASFGRNVVAQGKTFSSLGDYKIETADDPFTINGEDFKAYIISYANSPMEVTVVVCKERKCRKYLVLSNKLSVQYINNENYFGVERLDKSFEKTGYATRESDINKMEYFHQKVLGSGQKGDHEATQLIAAYFPFLLNDPVTFSAAK